MNVTSLIERLVALPGLIQQAEERVLKAQYEAVLAENELRKAKSDAYLDGEIVTGKNAEQRDAQVFLATVDVRAKANRCQDEVALRSAGLHALQNELSALRSVAELITHAGGAR